MLLLLHAGLAQENSFGSALRLKIRKESLREREREVVEWSAMLQEPFVYP
jgi:hypothetical protein